VRNARLAHTSVRTVGSNIDRTREGVKSGSKVLVWQDYRSSVGMNRTKTMAMSLLILLQ
jgi:hypothetical protein